MVTKLHICNIFCISTFREKMAQAYDFALEKMGMDIQSYQIWADYINFLKSVYVQESIPPFISKSNKFMHKVVWYA